jgi:phosphoribosylformimino-5-aminoimidazole carboxamide ribotide isomerase
LGGGKIDIIPAIDLRHGECVRLFQGDYNREIIFNNNPLEVALQWQSLGASVIHIVDLDGAAQGDVVNVDAIEKIAAVVQVPTQLGGGIRSIETITRVLQLGIERVILGTAAVENKDMLRTACSMHPEAIIVSIDARNGKVSTRGWLQDTEINALDLAKEMVALGVRRFIYTDITRDGTLSGPNYGAISDMVEAVKVPVIAAGGISSLEQLNELKETGVEGAIIGKALYTGDIDLSQALKIANR